MEFVIYKNKHNRQEQEEEEEWEIRIDSYIDLQKVRIGSMDDKGRYNYSVSSDPDHIGVSRYNWKGNDKDEEIFNRIAIAIQHYFSAKEKNEVLLKYRMIGMSSFTIPITSRIIHSTND